MKAIILLNGEPYRSAIDASSARVWCCDGAYDWAKGKVRIDENLGDYDSLSYMPDPPPAEVYPSEKNYTDGELALMRAIEAGADEIEFYGGGGGREDHFIGNLHLLYAALCRRVRARMITNYACIFAATGDVVIEGKKGSTLSIVPFGGEVHIMESGGFYYPLPKRFVYGSTRGISNVVTEERAFFRAEGVVLVLIDAAAV